MDYFLGRYNHAYCVFKKDYKKGLDTALGYLNSLENFISCGRQGLFRYVNMDYAIKMGLKSADFILNKASKDDALSIGTEKFFLG